MSNKSLLSFNYMGDKVYDYSKALAQARRLNPEWAIVVTMARHENKFAEALSAVVPNVIDRRIMLGHIHDEGDLSTRYSPEEYVDALLSVCTDPNLVLHVNNEPNVGTLGEMMRLTTWLATVVEILCSQRYNRRVVVGNFPPASEEAEWIRQGAYDPLIHTLNRHRGRAWYGAHAYTPFLLPLSVGTIGHDQADNPEAVHPSKWSRLDQLNLKATWHYPRFNWVVDVRARQLGYQPLPTVITEFGWAIMNDLPASLYAEMNSKFEASAGVHGLDGPFSLKNYWREVLNTDYINAMRLQLDWVISLTRNYDHIKALCLWQYGDPRDDMNWAQDDEAVEMVIGLIDTVKAVDDIDPVTLPVRQYPSFRADDERWYPVKLQAKSRKKANVCHLPTTTSTVISEIPNKDSREVFWLDEPYTDDAGYDWMPTLIKFTYHTDKEVSRELIGWIRSDVISVIEE